MVNVTRVGSRVALYGFAVIGVVASALVGLAWLFEDDMSAGYETRGYGR